MGNVRASKGTASRLLCLAAGMQRRTATGAAVLLLAGSTLVACSTTYTPPWGMPTQGSPTYLKGYHDGCLTGVYAARNWREPTLYPVARVFKDPKMFASDADYRRGWEKARPYCYRMWINYMPDRGRGDDHR
jgi:hypothetical protein